ncbi:quinone oxidoreductase family protein [Actinacidiphila bryophytorum]|uniref:quinone oxidoreductase family protein n=1 Tax=Actinacidiphila bryophytorum TaxID=1436133 RepID=UPI002176D921|nr:zinc-binding dehydrogenase [Actinacidiphila bryophytorum]UWE12817.1 zinc-binding dehydrogenase [Actinacidiphila bryophytorum]
MHAVGFDVNGDPGVLRSLDLPAPVPGAGQVLVRVAYAGVNYGELQHVLGDFGPPRGPRGIDVPGLEVSGEVAALGPGVSSLAVGDPVAAYLPDGGGYAEYAVAPAEFTYPLDGTSLRDAGGAALALTTAYGVLVGAARLRAGDTVLIHAAAGGVGSAAAQIARALGATAVYGTVGSAEKADYAKRFGYDAVHLRDAFADRLRDLDVVLDPVGGRTRLASLALLAPFGRLAVYGEAAREPDLTLPVLPFWKSNRSLTGYNIGDLARRAPRTVRGHALSAFALLTSGAIRLDVTAEVPLARAGDALSALASGQTVGKTLLAVTPH